MEVNGMAENAVGESGSHGTAQAETPGSLADSGTVRGSSVMIATWVALGIETLALIIAGFFDRRAHGLREYSSIADTADLEAACAYVVGFCAAIVVVVTAVLRIRRCTDSRAKRSPAIALGAAILLVIISMFLSFAVY